MFSNVIFKKSVSITIEHNLNINFSLLIKNSFTVYFIKYTGLGIALFALAILIIPLSDMFQKTHYKKDSHPGIITYTREKPLLITLIIFILIKKQINRQKDYC